MLTAQSVFDHWQKARQRFHAGQPSTQLRIVRERHIAFRCARHVTVVGHICNAGRTANHKCRLPQLLLHDFKQGVGACNGVFGAGGRLKELNYAGVGGAKCKQPGSHRQPALNVRGGQWVAGQPLLDIRGIAAREIDQDGVGISQRDLTILITGTWPKGFMVRKSGRLCALTTRSTFTSSKGRPSKERNNSTRWQ